jgi:hypothetical protein
MEAQHAMSKRVAETVKAEGKSSFLSEAVPEVTRKIAG